MSEGMNEWNECAGAILPYLFHVQCNLLCCTLPVRLREPPRASGCEAADFAPWCCMCSSFRFPETLSARCGQLSLSLKLFPKPTRHRAKSTQSMPGVGFACVCGQPRDLCVSLHKCMSSSLKLPPWGQFQKRRHTFMERYTKGREADHTHMQNLFLAYTE